MPISYVVDEDASLVRVAATGQLTVDEALRGIRAVAGELSSHHCGALTDIREMDYFPTTAEIGTLAIEFIRLRAAYRCGAAFIVDNDRHYSLGRLLAALADKGGVRIGVFREAAEAERWLAANDPKRPRPVGG